MPGRLLLFAMLNVYLQNAESCKPRWLAASCTTALALHRIAFETVNLIIGDKVIGP